jgi:hypothetical protein
MKSKEKGEMISDESHEWCEEILPPKEEISQD